MSAIDCVAMATMPTRYGEFTMFVYEGRNSSEHVALTVGDLGGLAPVLVRLHSECLTGDIFGSARCDCGEQLDASLKLIQQAGRGVLVYLRGHEGRGIGLANKLRAYALQEQGLDTVEANRALGLPDDARDYADAADILRELGVREVLLITNNPTKITDLEAHGITVVDRVPLNITPNPANAQYIRTKQERMGHFRPLEFAMAQD